MPHKTDTRKFITPEEFVELWEKQGLKYRIWELWEAFTQRGLRVGRDNFEKQMESIMRAFLVDGDARMHPIDAKRTMPKWWRQL
jgi:hypothetical protein